MQTNQLYLQKTGDGGFIEETGTLISAASGTVGIGTHIPASNATLEVLGNICLTGGRLGVQTLQPQTAAEIYGTLALNTSGATRGLWFGSGTQARGYLGASDYAVNGLPLEDFGISCAVGQNLAFGVGATEKMRLSSDGNVGIGTDTPSTRLSVATDTSAQVGSFISTDAGNVGDRAKVAHIENNTAGGAGTLIGLNVDITGATTSTKYSALFNGGHVGIGTTAPIYSLDVQTQNGGGIGVQSASDTNYGWRLKPLGNDLQIVQSLLAGGERLTIQDSGNVGIGTTDPDALLEIMDSVEGGTVTGLKLTNYLANDDSEGVSLVFGGHDTDLMGSIESRMRDTDARSDLIFSTNAGASATDMGERMRIAADGNVGIGVTNPSAPLHISTNNTTDTLLLESIGASEYNAPDLILYRNSPSPADNDNIGIIKFRALNDAAADIDYALIQSELIDVSDAAEKGSLSFYTRGPEITIDGNPCNICKRMTIDSDGNVGIGTSEPSGKLEIAGSGEGIVLSSPDGTQYLVTVANNGSVSGVAV